MIHRWKQIVAEKDLGALAELLAEGVVFPSPVVHTPQRGKPIALRYLAAALDGVDIVGVDIVAGDDDGVIVEFKAWAAVG